MKTILFLTFLFIGHLSFGQKTTRTVAFYNVENLFDTLNTPGKLDEEFLPTGKKEWNTEKYYAKLSKINTVLDSMDSPMLIGFCEVENRQVLVDLNAQSNNRKEYQIVHHESPDVRGIDNGIIYDTTVLTLVHNGAINVTLTENKKTRDILWAKFAHNEDTVIVFVNHWPSRRGGQVKSEPNRLIAANTARMAIDSILDINKHAKIIFMGDLNDYPDNLSVKQLSSVLKPIITPKSNHLGGTNSYRGEWNVLDHMMVSKGATKGSSFKVIKKTGEILSSPFLLTVYKGNTVPFRTFGGANHLNGYSDHLPVFVEVKLR